MTVTLPMEPPIVSASGDNLSTDHDIAEKDVLQLSQATSDTSSLVLSSSTSEVEQDGFSSDEDENPKEGPIDIDSGLPFISHMETSVEELQEALALLLQRFSVIPGIGKIFSVPSEQACASDKFVTDIDLEHVNHLHGSGQTVTTKSDDFSLSSLDPQTDPFAKREGKALMWRNVNMTLLNRGKKPNKKILDGVWGEVPAHETTAIMGASGAGKSSLLNLLSGRVKSGGKIRVQSDVRLNNYRVDPTDIRIRRSVAFVAQDDSLQATATPREAIRFSARLRLPRSTTDHQLDQLTERMIQELGLTSCADTIVGGPLIKGISGGERKRASVGVELVVKPSMVFLDEPTSGLDSFSAVQVCQVLKKVANSGASVLFTIHQPSSEIFTSFDRLILLHEGRVLFQGSVDSIPAYFASCGFPCPMNYNPADWIVTVAQRHPVSELERHGFFESDKRDVGQPLVPRKGQDMLGQSVRRSGRDERTPGFREQVKMLFKRELVYMYRFPLALYTRFGITAFLGALIGMIFYKVGEADPADPFNLQSQFGALMLLLMLAMLGTAQSNLQTFPEERPIFLREYSTDHYSVMSYFVSRLCVESFLTSIQSLIMVFFIYILVSFRGSFLIFYVVTFATAMSATALAVLLGVLSAGNARIAQQLLPVIFIPQLLFSGYFVSPDLVPKILRWSQYVCVLTYAVRLLMIEEFYNCSDNPFTAARCDMLVTNVKADPNDTLIYWAVMVIYFIFFRLLALYLLRKSATRFY